MAGIPSRRVSIRRIIGLLITAATAWYGVQWAMSARRAAQQVDAMAAAEMAHVKVDLSQPGVIETPIIKEYGGAHGDEAFLVVEGDPLSGKDSLAGLRATVQIVDKDSATVFSSEFPNVDWARSERVPGGIPVLYFFGAVPSGTHTLRLTVSEGATALAGREQILTVRYHVCGMEYWPPLVMKVIAFGLGMLFLVVGGSTLAGFIRHGWYRPAPGTPLQTTETSTDISS